MSLQGWIYALRARFKPPRLDLSPPGLDLSLQGWIRRWQRFALLWGAFGALWALSRRFKYRDVREKITDVRFPKWGQIGPTSNIVFNDKANCFDLQGWI